MRFLISLSTCSICSKILEDVVTIECNHHFCKLCLLDWIQNEEIGELETVPCPKCLTGFNPTSDTYKCPAMCDSLSVLQFICSNQLCEEKICYDEYPLHQQRCLYSPILCKFCRLELLQKDFDTHLLCCIPYITHQKSQLEVENKSLTIAHNRLKTKTFLLESKITSQESEYEIDFLKLENDSLKFENHCMNKKIKLLLVENDTLRSERDSLKINCSLKTGTDTLKINKTSEKNKINKL